MKKYVRNDFEKFESSLSQQTKNLNNVPPGFGHHPLEGCAQIFRCIVVDGHLLFQRGCE
jgi:hypothetical protein